MDDLAEEAHSENDTKIRLSLTDLFVWMTLTGLFCFLYREYLTTPWQDSLRLIWSTAPYLLAYPVCLTASVMIARHWMRRRPIDFQPGYWLMCVNGITALMTIEVLVIRMIFPALDNIVIYSPLGERPWPLLVYIAEHTCYLVLLVTAGFVLPVRWFWRTFLVLPLSMTGMSLISFILLMLFVTTSEVWLLIINYGEQANTILGPLLIATLTIVDVSTTNQRRDWLHWLGVILTLLLYLVAAAQNLLTMLGFV